VRERKLRMLGLLEAVGLDSRFLLAFRTNSRAASASASRSRAR